MIALPPKLKDQRAGLSQRIHTFEQFAAVADMQARVGIGIVVGGLECWCGGGDPGRRGVGGLQRSRHPQRRFAPAWLTRADL